MTRYGLGVVALLLVAAACGGGSPPVERAAPSGAAITDLTSIDQLRDRFNADSGKTRLIVLASPT